jgi:hypothetical protein
MGLSFPVHFAIRHMTRRAPGASENLKLPSDNAAHSLNNNANPNQRRPDHA